MNLRLIFDHQHSLANKYNPIEESFGYWTPAHFPAPLNTLHTQDRLRMFYAYICEELCEVYLAAPKDRPEELSDVLHFAAEFCLIAGVTPEYIEDQYRMRSALDTMEPMGHVPSLAQIQFAWGDAINLLKYKRWKQSPKDTDPNTFNHRVAIAFCALLQHIEGQGLDPETIYMAKHRKNEERIATGY